MTIFILLIILFFPFLSFIILIFFQKKLSEQGAVLASFVMLIAFVSSLIHFFSFEVNVYRFSWIEFGSFQLSLSLMSDKLTSMMLLLVTGVSFLVHLFSIEYMREDENKTRYFAYLGLFTFSMLGIVLSEQLLLLYIFWELVGLSSYLLIGFWYQKKSAIQASQKAFIVNRIGDFGFLIGIILLFVQYQSLELQNLSDLLPDEATPLNTWIALCLFAGVLGKSAQFPLQVWLPDAMEGPTPVSALIHAATMVAAGVYLLARIFFLLTPFAMLIIAFVGIITAFIGAFSALAQSDIKKVLAYSTISQLGYMVMGMGVGAYEASLFHLFTHAFFKAGLFLCAGAVIHSLHQLSHQLHLPFDAQNMYVMGGLRKKMPFTFWVYTICAAALAGLPFFSGFLSKDAILLGSLAWASSQGDAILYLIPIMGFLVAFLTAFYVMRQWMLVFWGDFKLEKYLGEKAKNALNEVQDAPLLMKIPLVILALDSLWICFSWNPLDGSSGWLLQFLEMPPTNFVSADFWSELAISSEKWHSIVLILSIALALSGLSFGYLILKSHRLQPTRELLNSPELAQLSFNSLYINKLYQNTFSKFLNGFSQRSFHFDNLYQTAVTQPILSLATLSANLDKKVIDAFVNFGAKMQVIFAHFIAWIDKWLVDGLVNVLAWLIDFIGRRLRSPQSGQIQSYVLAMLLFIILVTLIFWLNYS